MDITDQECVPQEQRNRLRQLELMFELASVVNRAKEPREIYRSVVEGLVQALPADRAAVLIFDPDGPLRFKAWIRLSDTYRTAMEGHAAWDRGARDAEPIAIADVVREHDVSAYRDRFTKEGIRAVAFVPLLGNRGIIGQFGLYWNAVHEFQPEELQVIQAIAADVAFATERQQAEIALRDSEQRLTLAQDAANLGVWDCDLRTKITTFSGEYARLHGFPLDHPPLDHGEWLSRVHPADRERLLGLLRESIERTHLWDTEFRYLWPDGSVRWLHGKGKVFLDDSGVPVRMTGITFDVTERKQAEAALRESEQRFRTLADTAPVMICASGPDRLATFFSKGWLNFTGRAMDQELGYGWTASVHPEDRERCLAAYSASFEARRDCHIEYRLRRADGEYRSVVCNGVPYSGPDGVFAGYIASCIDITDLKRTQAEAFERQKWESLGVLTQGIAHDFNNLLGGILAQAELAETELAAHMSPVKEIQAIKAVAIRASEIVRELMIYEGQDQDNLEPLNVSLLVEEMLQLLKISVSKRAVLKTDLPQALPVVQGNAAKIRQIVMNLIINASEAIGDRDGVITVTTARKTAGPDRSESDYLRLEVSDTGCGMTPETRAKIFDPFFTTKFAGRGLGLAVVQGIVRSHGGTINVTSTFGQGSRFEILLPGADQAAFDPRVVDVSSSIRPSARVSGTVLVIEDEETLRLAVSKMLRMEEFSVIEAGDGKTGTSLLRAHESKIDVVLLDATTPGMSGREVLMELRQICPDVKVILTTAHSQHHALSLMTDLRTWGYIRKPYQFAELASLIRAACQDRPGMSSSAAV
jgi:two-component system cell cycle sensor histidine kinase/response regulator CckA